MANEAPRTRRRTGLAGWTGVAVGAAVALAGADARADDANRPTWAFDTWHADVAIAGGEAVLGIVALAAPQHRSLLGPDSPHASSSGPNTASYWTAFAAPPLIALAGYGAEALLARHQGASYRPADALIELTIDAEAVLLAEGTTEVIKKAVGRCRPEAWHGARCDGSADDNFAAFPSGHTSAPAALAGARLALAVRSKGAELRMLRVALFGLAEVAAVSTAVLRVEAGAHSRTDVWGGWAIGHAAGVAVAFVHLTKTWSHGVSVGPGAVSWSGAF